MNNYLETKRPKWVDPTLTIIAIFVFATIVIGSFRIIYSWSEEFHKDDYINGRCDQACIPEKRVGIIDNECICETKRIKVKVNNVN